MLVIAHHVNIYYQDTKDEEEESEAEEDIESGVEAPVEQKLITSINEEREFAGFTERAS